MDKRLGNRLRSFRQVNARKQSRTARSSGIRSARRRRTLKLEQLEHRTLLAADWGSALGGAYFPIDSGSVNAIENSMGPALAVEESAGEYADDNQEYDALAPGYAE